ncbi:MAG: hypothetical protein V3W44_08495 [Dehalococcoidales bacterium]
MATVKTPMVPRLLDHEREKMEMDKYDGHPITNARVLAMDLEISILRAALVDVMNELGVPNKDYPAPATNAWNAAKAGLNNAAAL